MRARSLVAGSVLAVLLCAAMAGQAGAFNVTSFTGMSESGSITADHAGNVYVLADAGGLLSFTPSGARAYVPYEGSPEDDPNQARDVIWGPDDALWFRCSRTWVCHIRPDGQTIGFLRLTAGPMVAGPDGNVWFPDSTTNSIARVTPTGAISRFELPGESRNAGRLTVGADGNLWFPEPGVNAVGRITPAGIVKEFPLPAGVSLPSTNFTGSVTAGPDGNLWIILTGGIGRMDIAGQLTGQYHGVAETPFAIAPGPDGNVWFTEQLANRYGRITPSGRITEYDRSLYSASLPSALVTAADGAVWTFAWNDTNVWRIDTDRPEATTGAATSIETDRAWLTGLVSPRGGPTTTTFQYGPTTAYGSETSTQDAGDGDDGVLATATVADLRAATTYHYRLVAHNGMRTIYGADKTLTTAAPPPEPPPIVESPIDTDHDDYADAIDCNDHDATVHPGATDRPGDRIDQDCSGSPATYTRFSPSTEAGWSTNQRWTQFTKLTIGATPAEATVTLTCRGKGCRFRRAVRHLKAATMHTNLLSRLKHARLRHGAVLELRLAHPGEITTIIRWTIGPPPKRTTGCLAPGARKTTPCA
ncbi:virginiamycin B lyase family protein [Baekduia sp.]|jgi:streptogramin lyase|uniref:virginiamycin B lyase family protein n=1 Tax=Baekduia sp. TaxID=2600305 RepID=UPI002E09E7FE|nr:MopE-related protein [Baekduia sp.]